MTDLQRTCKSYAEDLNELYKKWSNAEYDDDEESSFGYWFDSEVLSVEVTSDLGKQYICASVCLGFGGPNIYLNTRTGYIEGYWGGDSYEYPVDKEVSDYIDDRIAEMWEGY